MVEGNFGRKLWPEVLDRERVDIGSGFWADFRRIPVRLWPEVLDRERVDIGSGFWADFRRIPVRCRPDG